ncbi:MAG: type VI secretion system tip protein TssI/VgrG [Minicystis sp.]
MTDESREGSLSFACGALPDDEVALHGVVGKEELSRLFSFDLLLHREKGPFSADELDLLLKSPCAIALGHSAEDIVHGLLSQIELLDDDAHHAARYRARLVPTAWLLTLARTDRLFQAMTVPEMVTAILRQYGLVPGTDFDVLTSGQHPSREYVVQFAESDWDFIQRWLEHEGLYYWFEHGRRGEKLIVSDTSADATPISGSSTLRYRRKNNLGAGGEGTIHRWNLVQRRIPARVVVSDYNYRTPALPLVSRADVDVQRGFGTVFTWGEHVKTPDEGAVIAALRAERIRCERRTFSGRSDCRRLRAGHRFTLEDHPDAENDGAYLLTAIEHHVGHALDGEGERLPYEARFTAIPGDVQFRPEASTPWPTIEGVLHAHIDGDAGGTVAEIDEQGRYRVKLPFDASEARGSKASRWIRMAQPYSGAGYGSHFPLHKGTEVLLAHVGGDPDRPIIVGSVPNPVTPGPVANKNASQSVIHTHSGIRIELEDQG